MQRLDWIVLAICAGIAWPKIAFGTSVFVPVEQAFIGFARHKRLALIATGALTIFARLALLPWMPVPQPKVHDEFSYLLAADTFIHARVANPPHPLWIFFDTFHVIQHPSYASMYPPAQGMILAFGKLVGNPWIGVVLSSAAMCVAITWMLQGWMSAEWALLGGALVLTRVGLFSYWMNSYWGGAVAATGAALLMGAVARIWDRPRSRDAIILGIGTGILATSRPVEGLVFCIPVLVALLWRCWQNTGERHEYIRRLIVPSGAILACVIGFIAYYNWRVTGNPTIFPHLIEQRQYIRTAIFLWQHDKPPIAYANPQFDDFYHNFLPGLYQASWPAAEGQLEWKSQAFWQFFIGPALSIPFLALPWLLGNWRNRLLVAQVALSGLGLWLIVYFNPHYAAPIMATVVILMMQGVRKVRALRVLNHDVGVGLTRLIVLFSFLIGPVYLGHSLISDSTIGDWFSKHSALSLAISILVLVSLRLSSLIFKRGTDSSRLAGFDVAGEFLFVLAIVLQVAAIQKNIHADNSPFVEDLAEPFRKPVEQQLAAIPGNHLVLVRYSKDHNSGEEYVYNDADIDRAKTVWAREIPGMDVSPLLSYFKDRNVWLYQPDDDNESVSPYERPNSGGERPAP